MSRIDCKMTLQNFIEIIKKALLTKRKNVANEHKLKERDIKVYFIQKCYFLCDWFRF